MMKQLFGHLLSSQCQLKSLKLDINNHFWNKDIHHCLTSHYDPSGVGVGVSVDVGVDDVANKE